MSISRSIAVALVLASGLASAAQANELTTTTGMSERAIIIVGGKGGDVSLNPQPLPPGKFKEQPGFFRPGFDMLPMAVGPGFWQGHNPECPTPGRVF